MINHKDKLILNHMVKNSYQRGIISSKAFKVPISLRGGARRVFLFLFIFFFPWPLVEGSSVMGFAL